MFFSKREKPPTPSWLKWLLIGFFLFAVLTHQQKGTPDKPNTFRQTVDSAAKELSPARLINFNEYKEKIFPSYVAALRLKDNELGKGLPAVCGQEATITYQAFLDEKPMEDSATAEKPLTFVIGEHAVMPVFEQGVIGMQPGGKRSLVAPSNLAYGAKGFARDDVPPNAMARFEVTLLGVSPPLPSPDESPYRIANVGAGGGTPILCGEPIKAHIIVWGTDGKKLYDTREGGKDPIAFTPGKSEVFLGLEQGVIGMVPGATRTLIVPPTFQKLMRGDKPATQIPLPENQTVLVDVESIP